MKLVDGPRNLKLGITGWIQGATWVTIYLLPRPRKGKKGEKENEFLRFNLSSMSICNFVFHNRVL